MKGLKGFRLLWGFRFAHDHRDEGLPGLIRAISLREEVLMVHSFLKVSIDFLRMSRFLLILF